MHISPRHAVALITAQSLAGVLGDFSGPSFPPPADLAGDQSLAKAAWKNLTAAFETGLGGTSANGSSFPEALRNFTFSVGLFSVHDPDATSLQFHYTSPEIAASTLGTRKVDDNTIYRVASVTKVFTVLAGLLSLTDEQWERPLSGILPALSGQRSDGVLSTPWDKITMRALAAQLGGVPRDGFPSLGEIALQMEAANTTEAETMATTGLPPANASDPLSNPPCLALLLQGNDDCPAVPYAQGVANRPPTFLPWSSPGYSNNGFTLLGLAMANATGRTIAELYQDHILDPLAMASTFSDPPPPAEHARSAIVGDDAAAAGFAQPNGVFVSSGGVFSTTRDLARFGRGILNSTLLAAERTRRWLKPVSHTARLQYAVGAPWEIVRHVSPTSKVTDLYTKSGDSGQYSAWLVLAPELGVGFSVLMAGSARGRFRAVAQVADAVTQAMVPALQRQAAAEAGRNLAGTYRGADGLNSTLVLATDEGAEGVLVESWVSNGTDVLPFLATVAGSGPYRLLPSVTDTARGQAAFRLVSARDSPAAGGGSASGALFAAPGMVAADWLIVDDSTYYGAGLSLFVFDVGRDGKATAVTMPAYRATLARSAEDS